MTITETNEQEQIKYHLHRISDINEDPSNVLPPITGYEEMPLVSLELAIEPLLKSLPAVARYATIAKQRCTNPPADGLTIDESASIMLYSMGWEPLDKCLFVVLNDILPSKYREKLAPWYLYLKLFLTALSRLPSVHRNIYRGIQRDLNKKYRTNQPLVWWGFSSCTNIMNILQSESFADTTEVRTLFNIKCHSGKDISKHCYYTAEDEIILLPGTKFKFQDYFYQGNTFRVIELEEISISSTSHEVLPDDEKQQTANINIDRVQLSSDNINTTTPSNQESGESTLGADVGERKRWLQNGVTVAGGNGIGQKLNQLFNPSSYCTDDDQTLYIADSFNNRIMKWERGATTGEIVAGGNGDGQGTYQFSGSRDVILDKDKNHLIICDVGNQRIVRWPRQNGTHGKILFAEIRCGNVFMDKHGYFYITNYYSSEIRRWAIGETSGVWKAGKGGPGKRLDQLKNPNNIFIDADHSMYISDTENHRVMKWLDGATEGIIVAGGHEEGNSLKQLAHPHRVVIDKSGDIYIADSKNHRIVCWPKGATEGYIVVGGNGLGQESNQFNYPRDLSFDQEGNLYVLDSCNHRVQRFDLDRS